MPESVVHGTLLSFDSSTWLAMVLLEGADAEAQIPVAQFVPPAHLVAGVEVAVLLLAATNTDDAVVLGAYGSAGNWTLPALNITGGLSLGSAGAASTANIQSAKTGAGLIEWNAQANAVPHPWRFLFEDAANTDGLGASWMWFWYGTTPFLGFSPAGAVSLSVPLQRAGTQVVNTRQTGWTAPTATPSRSAITNADTLAQTISHLAALVADLTTHGLIGP